jgi:1-acyl-sn-glycerol-3-phosphate acyltransferase
MNIQKRFIKVNQLLVFAVFKAWIKTTRNVIYKNEHTHATNNGPIIYAANHQTLVDTPVIFTGLNILHFNKALPLKFMTWHEYYRTKYKPILFSVGCYPSHGKGRSGLKGAYWSLDNGYGSFIYPEGTRTDSNNRGKAFMGIVNMIKYKPNARLILLHIEWEKREKLLSRPKLSISLRDAPKDLDRSNPDAIMDAVYET